jgi:thioredoxin-like negative regulator of GroEL
MPKDSFKSFLPFRRDLKTPCLIFCKWEDCHHCHQFAPHVRRAQVALKGISPVYVADAEQHASVMEVFKVSGYPELFLLKKDRRLMKYRGPRTAEGIVAFVMSNI